MLLQDPLQFPDGDLANPPLICIIRPDILQMSQFLFGYGYAGGTQVRILQHQGIVHGVGFTRLREEKVLRTSGLVAAHCEILNILHPMYPELFVREHIAGHFHILHMIGQIGHLPEKKPVAADHRACMEGRDLAAGESGLSLKIYRFRYFGARCCPYGRQLAPERGEVLMVTYSEPFMFCDLIIGMISPVILIRKKN